jgi:hypothetical protein
MRTQRTRARFRLLRLRNAALRRRLKDLILDFLNCHPKARLLLQVDCLSLFTCSSSSHP